MKLYAPNKFMKDEVEKNFLNKISIAINKIVDDIPISLDVISSNNRKIEQARETIPTNFKSNLNPEMTFDSFVEGKSNQLAKAACLHQW